MPPARRPLAAVAAALLMVVAAGCGDDDAPDPAASPTPSPSATAASPAAAVAAGDVELEVTAPAEGAPTVHASPAGDDGRAREVRLEAAGDGAAAATLGLRTDGTLDVLPDGSVSVLDADGTATGGLSAPAGAARFVAVDDTHVRIESTAPPSGSGATPGAVTTTLGTAGVVATEWGDREGGRSLAVAPTDWARSAGEAGTALVWAELVAADPEVDTATMHAQLECHAIGAPDKATWNLEPWRPDVGLVATMAARCNPVP